MNYLEVYFNGILKHSIPVQSEVISIGRSSSNDLVIDNMGVSNHHAIITKKDSFFFIEDLNSTNGTFLNNQKISEQKKIDSQDSITIGKHTIKFAEWSQSKQSTPNNPILDVSDATVMMKKSVKNKKTPEKSSERNSFHLILSGEKTGIDKLLLTKSSYSIGKAKDNDIRLKGWFFTPAHIAEIEKIGHSFYITPLKKNAVKLNNSTINSSTALSATDVIKIKKLTLRFLSN